MAYSSTIRVRSVRLALALAGLAFMVFLWGLAYKLSLYGLERPNLHRIPEAKLLTKNERVESEEALQAKDSLSRLTSPIYLGAVQLLLVLPALFASLFNPGAGFFYRQIPRPVFARSSASLNAFFFRPPPARF